MKRVPEVIAAALAAALGGGGEEDLRDGILTLPAALAIRDPAAAKIFCDPESGNLAELGRYFVAKLPEAEQDKQKIQVAKQLIRALDALKQAK